MSTTRSFANVSDDGLFYSGITAVETTVGTADSMLADPLLTVAAATNVPGQPPVSGLNWSRFVGSATGPGSSLSVVIDYDVTATGPAQAITAIRTNSVVPDTVVPPGARLVLKQEVFDADGNLIGVSLLEKDSSTSDTQDPPLEAGDIQLADAYGMVHVRLTLEIIIEDTAAGGTSLSFSAMRQTYEEQTLPASLGDYVWEDTNANGIQETGENGIGGVTVELLDGDGNVIGTDTTDGTGYYDFTGLAPGDYSVRFVTPNGYVPTTPDQGNDALDSDAIGGVTHETNLDFGEHDPTLDAGFYRLAALGDRVWYDTNQNGVQDGGENGVTGVSVHLLDATGTTVLATDVTDGFGNYLFDNLTPGTYRVRFDTPSGWVQTIANVGDDDDDSDAGAGGLTGPYTLVSGQTDLSVDAGIWRLTPSIEVVKTTNGFSTGAGTDGITLLAGSNVWWNYAVTNSGPVDLGNVVLTDDLEGVITNLVGGDDGDNILEVGETWLYKAQGTAVLGPYVNLATVTGDFTDGLGDTTTVSDTDPSNYVGVRPAIDIEKYVSVDGGVTFHDADLPTGPLLLEATFDPIFRFVVTNTGGVDLTDLVVSDDTLDLNGALPGSTVTIPALAVGASTSFEVAGTWEPDQHVNVATVDGDWTDDFGNTAHVTDSDAAHYFGEEDTTLDAIPVIDVVKTTNGVSTSPGTDGITLLAGSNVYWTYAVSNAGLVDISNVVLTDDLEGVITNLVGGDDGDSILEVGETWIYKASGTAVLGPYANVATVVGDYTNRLGETTETTDTDPSNYVGVRPDIDIEKYVSVDGGVTFHDADDPTGPTSAVGNAPIFKFVITNTGGVDLTNLVVGDDKLDLNGALPGGTVTIPALAVGASTEFQITGPFEPGQHVNVATVNGSWTDDFGNTAHVTDSDAAHYISEETTPGIDIEKTTNGPSNSNVTTPDYDNEDAANGAGVPILTAGSSVTWTYQVTNTGNVAFTRAQVAIVDDNGTPGITSDDMSVANGRITLVEKSVGDDDDLLEAGEVWIYEATGTVQALTTTGPATTFSFAGNTATDGSDGNVRSFSSGGIQVKASAFSRDSGGVWETGWLGAYGGGLGVTDRSEGSGSTSSTHTVDNSGRDNFVLFRFDQNVVVDKAYLGYVVNDSDMRVWIGSVSDAFNTTVNLSDSVLSSLGFTEVSDGGSSARWADFNAGNLAGNVVVIAANTTDASRNDYFKIEKLTVAATGDGIYENKATVTAGSVSDSDLSHYKNATAAPGIDLEKTTNGSSNSNVTAPNYDNEDAADGAGVPILTAGSDVTWTYKVTNTGNTTFARSEIVLVDDNGTAGITSDDMSIANGKIVLFQKTGGDQDDLLEAGESWLYKATGTVQNLTTTAAAVTFDFSGSSATDGTDGNVRSYSAGGISVKASAFSRDDYGSWQTGFLGAYGSGLGVTDRGEGSGGSDMHTIDNVGRDNYVLFRFDQSVVVDKAYLAYVVGDSDMTVWIGNINNAYNSSISLSDGVLAGLGFTEVNDTTLSSARWADFNSGNLSGNVLVVAASTADTSPDDRFKLEKLVVRQETQGGVYENEATVTAGGVSDSDLSHYKNGAPAAPGIDLEKTTNGSSNSNTTAPNYDNEDAASGAGVPILVAGSDVTWTYKVTNTGNTTFARSQIVLVDDNGTTATGDDMSIANGKIVLYQKTGGDQDDLLEAGESWLYQATGTVKDLTVLGAATTFDFSGSSATDGSDGNVRSYSAGGITVKASAFSRDDYGSWQSGWLGAYGGGLGVTDRSEGSGSGDLHTVDNVGRDNYVLFRFDQSVVVDKAYLGYVVGDSDATVWIGNIGNAFNTSISLSDSVLAGLGFMEINDTTLSSARWADFNSGNLSGNVLVIAASTADTSPDDRFKIEQLVVRTEDRSGVYENKATVTVGGVSDSDLSHYKNGAPPPPPTPGIDLEKTTSGSTNKNTTAATYDNEDTADGAGVPILKAGSDVTWTYKVTNTGETTFARSDIVLVDDNGTDATGDDMSIANGKIVLYQKLGGDQDDLLEVGESWLYKASGTVKDLTTWGAATTFDFSGSSAVDGTDGNVRSYSSGGISVKASAFSRTDVGGGWATGYLGAFGGGLGVTDRSESGSGDTHTVDNMGGRDNYVLFRFSEQVVVDKAYLGYVVGDSDMSIWIGNISNAFNTTVNLSDSVLSGLGFTEFNNTTSSSARWADFNDGDLAGNVLVIAASTASGDDRFKIEKLTVQATPEVGVYENEATVYVPGASDSDFSHYTNPDIWH